MFNRTSHHYGFFNNSRTRKFRSFYFVLAVYSTLMVTVGNADVKPQKEQPINYEKYWPLVLLFLVVGLFELGPRIKIATQWLKETYLEFTLKTREKRLQAIHFNEDEINNDFKCPITLTIMDHPVITNDGKHYERAAIKKWLNKALQRSSPLIPSIKIKFNQIRHAEELNKKIEKFVKDEEEKFHKKAKLKSICGRR